MPRPLRVGVQLPEVEREVQWPELSAIARAAEDVGFDSVWVGDHLLYRDDGRPECGPFVDRWNTWWDDYGNTADGFARLNAEITVAAEHAGRKPEDIERSACVLVALDPSCYERPIPAGISPLQGSMAAIADDLLELAAAGADEAILVVSPITQQSIEALGEVVALARCRCPLALACPSRADRSSGERASLADFAP